MTDTKTAAVAGAEGSQVADRNEGCEVKECHAQSQECESRTVDFDDTFFCGPAMRGGLRRCPAECERTGQQDHPSNNPIALDGLAPSELLRTPAQQRRQCQPADTLTRCGDRNRQRPVSVKPLAHCSRQRTEEGALPDTPYEQAIGQMKCQ
jgi:hypothetical protein